MTAQSIGVVMRIRSKSAFGSRANAGAELILLSLIKDHVKKRPDHDWWRPDAAMAWQL